MNCVSNPFKDKLKMSDGWQGCFNFNEHDELAGNIMLKYGFDEYDWESAKAEAKEILIERAQLRGMMSYSELVRKIQSIQLDAHDQRLFHLLGEISSEEDAERRGMLSVIVVHKVGDMQPGLGFFELAKELGRDTSDILNCWVDELKKVHRYWSNQ